MSKERNWRDSKLRLKSLAHEAVNILTNGLHSSDEKIAIGMVHILKTVGLYDGNGKILLIYQRHLKRLSGYKQYRGTPTFTES